MRTEGVHKPFRGALLVWLALVALGFQPVSHAGAQGGSEEAVRAAARQLGEEGIEALQDDQLLAAEDKLDRAYRLFATPTLGLWSARARLRAGHLVEAAERYRETMQTSADVGNVAAQKAAQQEAARELEALAPRMACLVLQLEGPDVGPLRLTLDGGVLPPQILGAPLPMNPGPHVLVASSDATRFERAFTLEEGQRLVLPIALPAPARHEPVQPFAAPPVAKPAASSSSTLWRTAALVSLSAGAAALLASGITALFARGALDDCSKLHGTYTCSQDASADRYERLRTGSTVLFYTGLGLAAVGFTTHLLAPAPRDSMSWHVGPGGLRLQGKF